jgi:hypothetical protein
MMPCCHRLSFGPGGALVRIQLLLVLLVLVACGEARVPPQIPPTPTPLVFTPLGDLLGRNLPAAGVEITTVGYVVADDTGARLLEGLSFSTGATPQSLADAAGAIWLGTDSVRTLGGLLQRAGDIRYAVVLAHGRLEGPGVYGPGGSDRYRMSDPQLQTIAPEETSIAMLIGNVAAYEGRVVRVAGALLAHSNSALLVEHLGSGGIPETSARQLKLRGPLRDQALLSRLKSAGGGAIHFGQVQVEGFWRAGQLTPLAILPIS